MLITTTEDTGGQKKMPENRTSCVKFKPYTMKPMALPGTAGGRLIWRAKASIRTLGKVLSSQRKRSNGLILHSDQGSPYTSKVFTDFCEEHNLTQSMSKAGCPYDNAPMERYFNTLKNEEIYLHEYRDEESLYRAVEHFAYTTYNHLRPHSYNGYRTPFEARYST